MSNTIAKLRTAVHDFLSQFAGENVLFIPNGGNAGDALIYAATLQAFSRASIHVTVVDRTASFRDQTVFLGGGGNLIGLYRGMRESIDACRSEARRIVMLPHTIRSNADLLSSLDDRTTIWCREVRSIEHTHALNPTLDVRLGHDMAFHCDVDALLADPVCSVDGPAVLQAALDRHHVSLEHLASLPTVRFMRTDLETLSFPVRTHLDVSRAFGSVGSPEASTLMAWCFLKTISVAKRVQTDRLHVAIACALLGKDCELMDNSYNKNREVHAHSLRDFKNITFSKTAGSKIADTAPAKRSLIQKTLRRTQRFQNHLWGQR